jgi:hypothetical protein
MAQFSTHRIGKCTIMNLKENNRDGPAGARRHHWHASDDLPLAMGASATVGLQMSTPVVPTEQRWCPIVSHRHACVRGTDRLLAANAILKKLLALIEPAVVSVAHWATPLISEAAKALQVGAGGLGVNKDSAHWQFRHGSLAI